MHRINLVIIESPPNFAFRSLIYDIWMIVTSFRLPISSLPFNFNFPNFAAVFQTVSALL